MRQRIYVLAAAFAACAALVGAAKALAKAEIFSDISIYREEAIAVVEEPSGQQRSTVARSWIKGPKMRTDVGGVDVTILRPDLDIVWNVNLMRRTYVESPISAYRKAARLSLAMLGADPFSWTERRKKIGLWNCREAIVADETNAGDRLKTTWWVSEDPGLEKRLMRHVMSIGAGPEMDAEMARFFEKLAGIPGYPVQTESALTHGGTTIKTVHTLQKMERREIADSQFELPGGLTRIVAPAALGAP